MSVEMVRIDDRFIHGQVVVGWCPFVKPDRLILCDDEIAQNEWECEIYKDAAMDYTTSICSISKTVDMLESGELKNEKIFLIVNSPEVLVKLIKLGLKISKVIVGGMHYQAGKRKITNFIYIDDQDLESFGFLVAHNVQLEGRDVPSCKPIDITRRLGLN